MDSEKRFMAIGGSIMAIFFIGLTLVICRNGWTWWALLTGFLALGGVSLILNAFGLIEDAPSGQSTGGAAGLAALFNSMDQKGAENFAKMLNNMGGSTETTPKREEPAGPFKVVVVDTLFDGSTNVKMQATLTNGSPPTRSLAVMCFDENGRDVLNGQDEHENWHKLDDVREAAVLYVPRETLPYLKNQPSLWNRVQECVEEQPR